MYFSYGHKGVECAGDSSEVTVKTTYSMCIQVRSTRVTVYYTGERGRLTIRQKKELNKSLDNQR